MENYHVRSGEIQTGHLYLAMGDSAGGTINYDGHIASANDISGVIFGGTAGVTTFTVTGNIYVVELIQFLGGCIEYVQTPSDKQFPSLTTSFSGFAVEFALNEAEKIVQETTRLTGFAIELIDYPFYCFTIIETRL